VEGEAQMPAMESAPETGVSEVPEEALEAEVEPGAGRAMGVGVGSLVIKYC